MVNICEMTKMWFSDVIMQLSLFTWEYGLKQLKVLVEVGNL